MNFCFAMLLFGLAATRDAKTGSCIRFDRGARVRCRRPARRLSSHRGRRHRARWLVTVLHLERPLVVPKFANASAGFLAGRMPFEVPPSIEPVRGQLEDVPHDSKNPLFPFGQGLTYPARSN